MMDGLQESSQKAGDIGVFAGQYNLCCVSPLSFYATQGSLSSLAIHKDVHSTSLPSAILISLGMLRMAGLRHLRQQTLAVQIRAKKAVRHLCHLLREKLLHQAFLEVLEGVELVRLQPDHLIKGGEAVGDFLLFDVLGNRDLKRFQSGRRDFFEACACTEVIQSLLGYDQAEIEKFMVGVLFGTIPLHPWFVAISILLMVT